MDPVLLLEEKVDPSFSLSSICPTPKDDQAAVIIRCTADEVMHDLMVELGIPKWQELEEHSIERIWKPPEQPANIVPDS